MKSGSEIDALQNKPNENQAEPIRKFKRKQRRKKVLIVCAAVLVTAIVLLIAPQILPASISYGESELYTREEQKEAVDFILDSFKEWKGCKLYSIYYTSDDFCLRELEYGTILSKEDLEKQMEAFQIQEEEFFAQKVADSIFGIVHGIREAHFDDNTTAPRINIQHLIGGIESYVNLVAEPNVNDMFESICEDYGINPDTLSYQQTEAFKEVLKKSIFLTKGRRGKNG